MNYPIETLKSALNFAHRKHLWIVSFLFIFPKTMLAFHVSLVLWPSRPPSSDHGSIVWLKVQIMELIIFWHIDPLLGDDSETNNATTTTAKQQLHKY
jgi:hypothetical protein